ncbi:MAG: hypothetical protein R3F42_10095 [Pseudomonadota bacterium]
MDYEEESAGETRRHGPGPGTWGLMALVAIITIIAVWLVPVDDKEAPTSLPSLPGVKETSQQSPGLSESPASATAMESSSDTGESVALDLPLPPGGVATVTEGGEGARTFLYKLRASGGQPDPAVVFAEAERLQGGGELEDAYLLYRYAARHGHAQAAMLLGTAADPAFHSAATSYLPEPDPGQARKWYSMAAAAGNTEADQRLEDLHGRLERAAAAGDEQAARLLLQWR